MNARLRYTKNPETGLMLTKEYVAGDRMVYAVLDMANKRVSIREVSNKPDNMILSEDHPDKSLAQLKKLTKPLLESLGVVFYNETRVTNKMTQEDEERNDAAKVGL